MVQERPTQAAQIQEDQVNSYCFLCFAEEPEQIFEVLYPEHQVWDVTHYCPACFLKVWLRHKRGHRQYVITQRYYTPIQECHVLL